MNIENITESSEEEIRPNVTKNEFVKASRIEEEEETSGQRSYNKLPTDVKWNTRGSKHRRTQPTSLNSYHQETVTGEYEQTTLSVEKNLSIANSVDNYRSLNNNGNHKFINHKDILVVKINVLIAEMIMTIIYSVSSATYERSFSTTEKIKNWSRSKMLQHRFSDLFLLNIVTMLNNYYMKHSGFKM
ncbi:Hypothetical protein CINCED_3A017339 [Cinara cedri]|uniref:Uncharacterized protein n=1 Tax=Cinara cedri TaxID=506608 RepID=A0A5E4MPQ9_9HEMI|nr:Hypothetical protein CINCED_3A017339 [Cinara cedri]